jgi:zinc/manganese transport system substrate-binding protein
VLRNSDADPHLFEVNASTARAIATADLIVYNGMNYDAWMTRMLSGAPSTTRRVIEAAAVVDAEAGANPHLWYDQRTMPAVARAIAAELGRIDPSRAAAYEERLQTVIDSLGELEADVARLRARHAGAAVAATEPVADYLLRALGLDVRNARFQLAVMNNTEPSARDTAAFETDLRTRAVRVLINNPQIVSPAVRRLLAIAQASGVPIVSFTESEPAGLNYVQWMRSQLDSLDHALSGPAP